MYLPVRFHPSDCPRSQGANPRTRILALLLWAALSSSMVGVTGCVSMPAERATEDVGGDELSTHVRFLSQPRLKGRKPGTRGSAIARRYIHRQFKACGLVPWGKAKGYAQPFGLGTNMIGVLPGVDPNLADEMVIVAAHYDHLGKDKDGLHPGACDNASGVAALLEIAETLALRKERPRRSMCFAAFDCEETFALGAFVFTCRDDLDESRIVGVVNIDMLGRDAFAVLDNCLFLTGTERYADLRERILPHVPDGLALLPMGTEIAGPRGDHIAFETIDRPVLFFTCGPHEDYHRPTDTPEKLDYECVHKSVDVITRAVDALAGSDHAYRRDPSDDGHMEELKAFQLCLSKVRNGHEAMGWTEVQARRLDPVIEQVERLLGQPRYTRQDRLRLLRTATQPLIALATWPDFIGDPNDPNESVNAVPSEAMIAFQTLYTEHRVPFVQAARGLVKHLLSQRVTFLLGRPMNHTVVGMDVPDHLIFLEPVEPPQYRLEFLFLTLIVGVRINDSSGRGLDIRCGLEPMQCTGTKEELTDYCLLLCRRQVRRASDPMWLRVLAHVTGETGETTYESALQSRLAEGRWPDERTWILRCARSENPELRHMAIATLPRVLGQEAEPLLLRILADPDASIADREAVISAVNEGSSAEALIEITGALSDQTPIKRRRQRDYEVLTRPSTPFEGYPLLPLKVAALKKWLEEDEKAPRTISDLAQERLRALTKHNLGKDAATWRTWIETNWTRRSK